MANPPQNYIVLDAETLIIDSCKQANGQNRSLQLQIGDTTQLILPANANIPGNGVGLLGVQNDGTLFFTTGGGGGPSGPAGGDLSGSYPNPLVVNIHGASVPIAGSLIIGNILQVSGSSALTYGAVNLAGGPNYVVGLLPTINQVAQRMIGDVIGTTSANTLTMAGDVTGRAGATVVTAIQTHHVQSSSLGSAQDGYVLTWKNAASLLEFLPVSSGSSTVSMAGDITGLSNASTVVKINGTSVPATPTANQVLVATSGMASTWEQISNAQISTTAAIAVSKLAAGTSAQVLLNSGTPTPTWTSLSGDMTVGNTGTTAVAKINGVAITGTPSTGYVPTATSSTAATWQAVSSPSIYYGNLYGSTTFTSAAITYVVVNTASGYTWNAGLSSGTTNNTTNGTITVTNAGTYVVSYSGTWFMDQNDDVTWTIYQNGVAITSATQNFGELLFSNTNNGLSIQVIVSASASDNFSLAVYTNNNNDTVYLSGNFSVITV